MVRLLVLLIALSLSEGSMAEHVQQARLKLLGLYCEGCVNRVQRLIKRFEGVDTVTVDLASSTVLIKTKDNQRVNIMEVKQALKLAGFETQYTVLSRQFHLSLP